MFDLILKMEMIYIGNPDLLDVKTVESKWFRCNVSNEHVVNVIISISPAVFQDFTVSLANIYVHTL